MCDLHEIPHQWDEVHDRGGHHGEIHAGKMFLPLVVTASRVLRVCVSSRIW